METAALSNDADPRNDDENQNDVFSGAYIPNYQFMAPNYLSICCAKGEGPKVNNVIRPSANSRMFVNRSLFTFHKEETNAGWRPQLHRRCRALRPQRRLLDYSATRPQEEALVWRLGYSKREVGLANSNSQLDTRGDDG